MHICITDFHLGGADSLKVSSIASSLGVDYVDPTQQENRDIKVLVVVDPKELVNYSRITDTFGLGNDCLVLHFVQGGNDYGNDANTYLHLGIYPKIFWQTISNEISEKLSSLREFDLGEEMSR